MQIVSLVGIWILFFFIFFFIFLFFFFGLSCCSGKFCRNSAISLYLTRKVLVSGSADFALDGLFNEIIYQDCLCTPALTQRFSHNSHSSAGHFFGWKWKSSGGKMVNAYIGRIESTSMQRSRRSWNWYGQKHIKMVKKSPKQSDNSDFPLRWLNHQYGIYTMRQAQDWHCLRVSAKDLELYIWHL